jgi:hypothetical protein
MTTENFICFVHQNNKILSSYRSKQLLEKFREETTNTKFISIPEVLQ